MTGTYTVTYDQQSAGRMRREVDSLIRFAVERDFDVTEGWRYASTAKAPGKHLAEVTLSVRGRGVEARCFFRVIAHPANRELQVGRRSLARLSWNFKYDRAELLTGRTDAKGREIIEPLGNLRAFTAWLGGAAS